MTSESIPKYTNSLVPTKYYDAFTYRLMGLTYEQIAEKTGFSEIWIKKLFARGGILYEFWQSWLKTAKEESIDEALTMMFGHLPDIVRTRIVQAKSMGAGSVESSKMIFKHTLERGQNDEGSISQTPLEVSDARKHMIINAFLNFKILNDKSDTNNPGGRRDNSESGTAS